jgi:hypothetical protein
VMSGEPWPDLAQRIQSGNVKGSWPDARDHWGTYHNKLEAVFVVRIPTKLDRARIVPGRENVFIAPIADCVPGEGKDNARYFSNQLIEACFVLKSPDSLHDRERLAAASHNGQTNVQVQYLSDRDKFHGMTNVTLREEPVSYDERLPDVLERIDMKARFGASRDHWCDATLGFSMNVASIHSHEQGAMDAILRLHAQLQVEGASKRHLQEDIGRFKPAEMVAAIKSIDQALPHAYTVAFYYTSVKEAKTRIDGNGLSCGHTGALKVSLRSPADLGWEQYGGGRWEDTAGSALWGAQWQRLHSDELQAVVVLGVPTRCIDTGSSEISIPPSLMVTQDGNGNTIEPRYANAHVQKSYILNAVSRQQTGHTEEDILAQNNDETYNPLFRNSRTAATGSSRNAVDDVSTTPPLDTGAYSTMLSVDELFDVVDTDKNGHISFAEFEAFWRQRLQAMGESTADEALARARSIFEDLDEDGTGSLDREEFRVVMTEVLASEWTPRLDRVSGRTYYVNLKTRATSWALPDESDADAFVKDHFNQHSGGGHSGGDGGSRPNVTHAREQTQFVQGAHMVATQSIPIRNAQRKGSNHVAALSSGDSFQISSVLVDNLGTHGF